MGAMSSTIGGWMNRQRVKQKMHIAKLARMADIPQDRLNDILVTGDVNPTSEECRRITEALGVSMADYFRWTLQPKEMPTSTCKFLTFPTKRK